MDPSQVAERLYQCLSILPSREAEQELVCFRERPDAWELSIAIVVGASGVVPNSVHLFAAQTLYACARRLGIVADGTAVSQANAETIGSKQHGLLIALRLLNGHGSQQETLICAAFAALGVRNCGGLRDVLSCSLQQLPQSLAAQLLLAVAEEGEALQARMGACVQRRAPGQQGNDLDATG